MKNDTAAHAAAARIILITAAAVLLAAGILLGDNAAIFRKAVFICMECIGIG
jgi:hypothetical protein